MPTSEVTCNGINEHIATAEQQRRPEWVAGADGCRAGWFVVLHAPATGAVHCRTIDAFEALLQLPEASAVIAIDAIIGLPDAPERGGRTCDRAARQLLGGPRASSVFSPPAQAAVACTSYAEALSVQRACSPHDVGLSKQAFHLFPKLRDLDRHMTPALQDCVREAHPELSFFAMNGGAALAYSKHTAEGLQERRRLLVAHGFPGIEDTLRSCTGHDVRSDDILDAYAACWTAGRIAAGTARRVPSEDPPRNARGLRMEIWR